MVSASSSFTTTSYGTSSAAEQREIHYELLWPGMTRGLTHLLLSSLATQRASPGREGCTGPGLGRGPLCQALQSTGKTGHSINHMTQSCCVQYCSELDHIGHMTSHMTSHHCPGHSIAPVT